jgi:hypothetical protein
LTPGQFVPGQVDSPGRLNRLGPSVQRRHEGDGIVEVRLRSPWRRHCDVSPEELGETSAQRLCGHRDKAAHLIPPLAPQRVSELLNLPPRDAPQLARLFRVEPELGADGSGVDENRARISESTYSRANAP